MSRFVDQVERSAVGLTRLANDEQLFGPNLSEVQKLVQSELGQRIGGALAAAEMGHNSSLIQAWEAIHQVYHAISEKTGIPLDRLGRPLVENFTTYKGILAFVNREKATDQDLALGLMTLSTGEKAQVSEVQLQKCRGITKVDGISALPNVRSVWIWGTSITDLAPLGKLTNLTHVEIDPKLQAAAEFLPAHVHIVAGAFDRFEGTWRQH